VIYLRPIEVHFVSMVSLALPNSLGICAQFRLHDAAAMRKWTGASKNVIDDTAVSIDPHVFEIATGFEES